MAPSVTRPPRPSPSGKGRTHPSPKITIAAKALSARTVASCRASRPKSGAARSRLPGAAACAGAAIRSVSRVRRAPSRAPRAGARSPTAASQRSRSPADAVWSRWASWAPRSFSASSTAPAASARSVAATTSPAAAISSAAARSQAGFGSRTSVPAMARKVASTTRSDPSACSRPDCSTSSVSAPSSPVRAHVRRSVLGGPPRPGGDARDQAGGGRAEAAERRGRQPMAERPERAGLVVHRGQPVAQRPLDAPGDAALVIEERLEAGPGESPDGEVRLGHHRRGARRVGEERHLPEHLAGPERRERLLAGSVAGDGGGGAAGQHRRPAVLDHVEPVGPVTLADDDLARREAHLLELAGQPGEVQASEMGEERGVGRARSRSRDGRGLT